MALLSAESREPARGSVILPDCVPATMSDRDLIWAAPYSIKKKLYVIITTSTSDVVMLVDRNGQKF